MAQRIEDHPELNGLPTGTQEDKALTLAFQRGNKGAYQQIHDRYRDRVQRVCRRMLSNPQDAQDAAQETFLRVYQALGRFNGRYQLGPWITRIATNVCLDHIRAKNRRPTDSLPIEVLEFESGDETQIEGPDSIVIRRSEGRRVRKVLESLPPMHRAAIVLRDFEGFSYQEVAVALGITECQVKALIHRARQGFKRSWPSVGLGVLLPARLFQRARKLHAPKPDVGHTSSIQHFAETFTASAAPAASSCSAAFSQCGQFVIDKFAPALTAVAIGAASLTMPGRAEPTGADAPATGTEATEAGLTSVSSSDSTHLRRSMAAVNHDGARRGGDSHDSATGDMPEPVPVAEASAAPDATATPAEPAPSPSTEPPPPPPPAEERPASVQPSEGTSHPSGFSFGFGWNGTFAGRSCQCAGPAAVGSERTHVSDAEGIISFEQSVSGSGTAAGSQAFRVELTHQLQQTRYDADFRLQTADGTYVYSGSAPSVERRRTSWGGWSYTYSGTYVLGSRPGRSESVPERGTYVVTLEASVAEQRVVSVVVSLTEWR